MSALEHLATRLELSNLDPSLAVGCLGALVSCVKVADGTVMVTQGLEELATLSAVCLLYTFSYLSAVGPSSGVLVDVCQQYARVFPPDIRFSGLPFHHIFGAIHSVLYQGQRNQHYVAHYAGYEQVQWRDYQLSGWEGTAFIHSLTNLAQSEHKRGEEVSPWILCFVLHTLSMVPPPSTLVVVNCLSIIAISLDCNISEIRNIAPDQR